MRHVKRGPRRLDDVAKWMSSYRTMLGRTKLVNVSLFHTQDERDGMLHSGMEQGMNETYAALDKVLASLEATLR